MEPLDRPCHGTTVRHWLAPRTFFGPERVVRKLSRSPFELSVNKATPGLRPARARDDNGRSETRDGLRDIVDRARQRSDAYLPIVVERLRGTVATWRTGRRSSTSATAARSNGGGLVNDDPLGALAAELTSRIANGAGIGGPRHDLGPGRTYLVTGCAGFVGSHL
jgi:hypothetical protein